MIITVNYMIKYGISRTFRDAQVTRCLLIGMKFVSLELMIRAICHISPKFGKEKKKKFQEALLCWKFRLSNVMFIANKSELLPIKS